MPPRAPSIRPAARTSFDLVQPRASLPLVCLLLVAGCAHSPSTARPPTTSGPPLARIVTDDDFGRLRADYEVMAIDAPERAATRDHLEAWLLDEARREQAAERNEEAWEAVQRALGLWDPDDLKSSPRDPALAAVAEELERPYRRRGAHRETLMLLGVQVTLRPEDAAARARFDEVIAWMHGDEPGRCGDPGCEKLIEDLEAAVAAFPSPFLVEQLASLYWQRQQSATSFGGERPTTLADLIRRRSVQRTAFDLARLYLRVSQPDKAQAALARVAGQPGDDPSLRDSLDRMLAPGARPMDAVALASQMARDAGNRAVGERICADAARRFPSAAEPQRCVGELAIQLDRVTVAIRALERAVVLEPDKREAWEQLAQLHQLRLAQLSGDERTDQLEAELKRVEALHEDARKRFPGEPLKTSLAGAFYEVGRGYFNAGRIEEAVRYLQRSKEMQPTVAVEEQLAVIAWRDGHPAEAVTLLRGALELLKQRAKGSRDRGDRDIAWWSGKIYRGLGDALDAQGNAAEALDARRRSLEAWDRVLAFSSRLEHDPDETAEAELERGRLLYTLGEHDRGIAAIERAIDAAPERSPTYAEALAFLCPRGELGEALDAYHRALGRAGVSDYIKIYASLWVLDLGRRLGEADDPLARQFLDGVRGARWHHELARWAGGKQSDEELAAHADTTGKRCELDFYRATRELGAGHLDAARALWKGVIGSRMMSFFEYDMASWYLAHEAQLVFPGHPAAGAATRPAVSPAR